MRLSLVSPASAEASAGQQLATLRQAAARRRRRRRPVIKARPKLKSKPKPKPKPPVAAPAPVVPVVTETQRRQTHLLLRTSYGLTAASVAAIAQSGTDAWIEQQLNPTSIPDPVGDRIRSLYPELGRDIPATRAAQDEFSWNSMFAVGQATLALSIWSSRQLYEVMVDFWGNHLNVTCPSDGVWDNRADYETRVIRANALGKYSEMLLASATHPAMLHYLNNRTSTKQHPNENYGRELLELHTVGIDTNYGEGGVLTSSRIMTGWTVDYNTGLATYKTNRHWTGRVSVLGFTHANASSDGRPVVQAYINYLARLPQTANRIATKLCQRFVADTPPESLVSRLASVYLSNDTEIKPVLRALFSSDEFWASRGQKVKRPREDVASTVRVLGHGLLPTTASTAAVRKGVQDLYWMTWDMQNAPYAWSLPTGYPDAASEWASAEMIIGKINSHRSIAETWWPSASRLTVVKPQTLIPTTTPMTYGTLVDLLSIRLTGATLPAASRNAVLAFFGKGPLVPVAAKDEIRGWRAGALVTLILNSPAAAVR